MPDVLMTPFIAKALLEGCTEMGCQPVELVLHAKNNPNPQIVERAVDDMICLNVSPSAVRDLLIDKHGLSMWVSFEGKETSVFFKPEEIMGIRIPVGEDPVTKTQLFWVYPLTDIDNQLAMAISKASQRDRG